MTLNKNVYTNGEEAWIFDVERKLFVNVDTFEEMEEDEFYCYWNDDGMFI